MMSVRANLLLFLGFTALSVFTFSNLFTIPFYLDDYDSIVNNLLLKNYSYAEVFGFYPFRQLGYLVFAYIQQELSGQLVYFHAASLIIHLLNVTMLTFLIRFCLRLHPVSLSEKQQQSAALLTGALFLVLPLNSQAVAYIVQLPTLLACFFYLLAIFSYLKLRIAKTMLVRAGYLLLLVLAVLAGIMSKQNFFTLPLALLIVEWLLVRRMTRKKLQVSMLSLISLLLLFQVIDFAAQTGIVQKLDAFTREALDITRWEYLTHQLVMIPTYMFKALIPYPLLLEYSSTPYSWQNGITWLGLFFLLAVLFVVVRFRSRWSLLSAMVLLYFCAHIVESSLLPITDLAFEHRAYLPNAFLCTIIAVGLVSLCKIRTAFAVISVALLMGYAYITHQRFELWNDQEQFYRQNLVHVGDNSRAYAAIALKLAEQKRYDVADHWYSMAIQVGEETRRLSSATVVSYMEMLQSNGEVAKARVLGVQLLKRITKSEVRSLVYATMAVPHVNQNRCFMAKGLINRAIAHDRNNIRAIELKRLCDELGYKDPLFED